MKLKYFFLTLTALIAGFVFLTVLPSPARAGYCAAQTTLDQFACNPYFDGDGNKYCVYELSVPSQYNYDCTSSPCQTVVNVCSSNDASKCSLQGDDTCFLRVGDCSKGNCWVPDDPTPTPGGDPTPTPGGGSGNCGAGCDDSTDCSAGLSCAPGEPGKRVCWGDSCVAYPTSPPATGCDDLCPPSGTADCSTNGLSCQERGNLWRCWGNPCEPPPPPNTPTPVPPTPTPTPTPYIRVRTLNPQFIPVVVPRLCKAKCNSVPCTFPSCQYDVSVADFTGAQANRGGSLNDFPYIIVLGVTPIQNGVVNNSGTYSADCREVGNGNYCYYWPTALDTGSRVVRYIVATPTPYPTVAITGVLRQKSGTGCYQADASNYFTNPSFSLGIVPPECITPVCAPNVANATAYSCTIKFDNQGCTVSGRPATSVNATLSAIPNTAGFSAGQWTTPGSCTTTGNTISLNAVDGGSLSKDIAFPFTGDSWIKLKNTSFTAASTTSNNIPVFVNLFKPGDSDDDASQEYFIMSSLNLPDSSAGVALGIVSNAYSAKNWSHSSYDKSPPSMYPSAFLSYVKSRKEYQTITDLNDLAEDKINLWEGDLTLNNAAKFNNNKVVLIVNGTLTLSMENFQPTNSSTAFVAQTINFYDGSTFVKEAEGLFIAQTVNTGSTANQGLKIKGNLIAQSTLNNSRSWSDTSRPSVFIVFDPIQYINLLPYLSTVSYQWNQIQ